MRPLEIRSGGRSPPDPDINAVSGQGDVLLQILLRQVVPGVVTQGPAQEPGNGKAREHWLAVQEDRHDVSKNVSIGAGNIWSVYSTVVLDNDTIQYSGCPMKAGTLSESGRIRPHLTPLECGIIFGGIPAGAISRKGGLIWGIPVKGRYGVELSGESLMPVNQDYSREAWSRRKKESTGENRPPRRPQYSRQYWEPLHGHRPPVRRVNYLFIFFGLSVATMIVLVLLMLYSLASLLPS